MSQIKVPFSVKIENSSLQGFVTPTQYEEFVLKCLIYNSQSEWEKEPNDDLLVSTINDQLIINHVSQYFTIPQEIKSICSSLPKAWLNVFETQSSLVIDKNACLISDFKLNLSDSQAQTLYDTKYSSPLSKCTNLYARLQEIRSLAYQKSTTSSVLKKLFGKENKYYSVDYDFSSLKDKCNVKRLAHLARLITDHEFVSTDENKSMNTWIEKFQPHVTTHTTLIDRWPPVRTISCLNLSLQPFVNSSAEQAWPKIWPQLQKKMLQSAIAQMPVVEKKAHKI